MGFWDWLTGKKDDEFINLKDEKEWIQVELSLYLEGSDDEKEFYSYLDIVEIFLNARAVYDSEGQYLGYINPKLNKNFVYTRNSSKGYITRELSKRFLPETKEVNGKMKLTFTHKGKYSLPALYNDLFILWNICDDILRIYLKDNGTPATFNPIFIDNKPAIENLEKLLKFRYKVQDRLEYGEKRNKFITEKCLGGSIEKFLYKVKRNKFYSKDTKLSKAKAKEVEKWIKEVEALLN